MRLGLVEAAPSTSGTAPEQNDPNQQSPIPQEPEPQLSRSGAEGYDLGPAPFKTKPDSTSSEGLFGLLYSEGNLNTLTNDPRLLAQSTSFLTKHRTVTLSSTSIPRDPIKSLKQSITPTQLHLPSNPKMLLQLPNSLQASNPPPNPFFKTYWMKPSLPG